jgi:hypothetical protein
VREPLHGTTLLDARNDPPFVVRSFRRFDADAAVWIAGSLHESLTRVRCDPKYEEPAVFTVSRLSGQVMPGFGLSLDWWPRYEVSQVDAFDAVCSHRPHWDIDLDASLAPAWETAPLYAASVLFLPSQRVIDRIVAVDTVARIYGIRTVCAVLGIRTGMIVDAAAAIDLRTPATRRAFAIGMISVISLQRWRH